MIAAVPFKKQMRKQILLAIIISLLISLPVTLIPGFFIFQADLEKLLKTLEIASYDEVDKHLATGWQPHNVDQMLSHLNEKRPDAQFFLQKSPFFLDPDTDHTVSEKAEIQSLIKQVEQTKTIQVSAQLFQGKLNAAIPIVFQQKCLNCHVKEVASGQIRKGMLAGSIAFQAPISFAHVSSISLLLFLGLFFVNFVLIALYLTDRFLQQKLLSPLKNLSARIRSLRLNPEQQSVEWQRTPQSVLEIDEIDHDISKHISTLQGIYNKLDALIVTEHETGLFHRDRFNEVMQYEVLRCRRYDRIFSVVLIKLVKARPVKPEAIAQLSIEEKKASEAESFSRFLKIDTRNTDLTFRITENLFVVVAPETDRNGARILQESLAQRILQSETSVLAEEHDNTSLYEFDFQIGSATFSETCSTAKQMMHDAAEKMKPAEGFHSG